MFKKKKKFKIFYLALVTTGVTQGFPQKFCPFGSAPLCSWGPENTE